MLLLNPTYMHVQAVDPAQTQIVENHASIPANDCIISDNLIQMLWKLCLLVIRVVMAIVDFPNPGFITILVTL